MVNNKRGWIRIMEASISILIIASVLLVIYSKQIEVTESSNGQVDNLLNKATLDIGTNQTLRNAALANDSQKIEDYLDKLIPQGMGKYVRICNITDNTGISSAPCKILDNDLITDKNIYSSEVIISSNSSLYRPLKVKIFLWEI